MITLKPDNYILSLFDSEGVWTGPAERIVVFNGEFINIDTYASENGITWPDA